MAPLHPAPERDQFAPLPAASFVTVAVKFFVAPTPTLAVPGETLTLIGGAVSVMVAEAFFDPSRFDVATNVTLAGDGNVAGAVYVTDVAVALLSVPHAPLQPERLQFTPKLPGSLLTVAVKLWLWLSCTVAVGGDTPTETDAMTVTAAEAERVLSATEVAVTVTPPLGIVAGAV